MDSEIIPSVDEWDERRAKTSSGKRKHNGGSSEPKTAPDHRGDPANDVSNSARASTSHGRHASSRMAGSEASGMVDAASASPASADLSGDIQPRVHSRRRSRAAPVDFIDRGLRPKKSLDNELSLEEFSSNTRKELNYFDAEVLTGFIEADPRQAQDSSAQRSGPEMGLRRGSSFKEISSLGSSRHIALRTQRNTVTGSVDIVDSAPRDRGLQRGGSFKGSSVSRSLRRDESFKGSLQEVDETKPSMRRVGSFRTGPAQGSSSSKESQRIAHMSALNKQTSWIRASPVPSPEQSPQSTNPGFIARWKESIFGGDASQKVIPAEEEASTGLSESKLRGPSDRKLSRDSIATKQLDDSDYAGSNRPRDNVAPSERLKYVMKRGPENDNSDGGSRGQLLSNNTPESSVIYPKPASEKMSILRFKLDEGQKALEKRLLVSNAEAMHKFPGFFPAAHAHSNLRL